ncbi:cnh domain containing [Anaeramoeba flamelloides]|uniref:Cnh domain containing n=1 Tax=Anaeramoeba flamelloides TaxID=1746091 RepID=A0AAV7ZR16_9EUKA|nr:cnh domain containing [Anaeramoeba flamelloides]
MVEIFNLPALTSQSIICQKRALIFSYDQKDLLCVGLKSKLIFYKYGQGSFKNIGEMIISFIPKTIEWINATKLIVGSKKEYRLINYEENNSKLIFTIGKNATPIARKINDEETLVVKDKSCHFLDANGVGSREYNLKWKKAPREIIFFSPYIIGILPTQICIGTLYTNQLIQIIPIQNSRKINLERIFHKCLYIVNNEGIWRLESIPLENQVNILLKKNSFKEALELCGLREDIDEELKTNNLNSITIKYAQHLFNIKNFEESMKIFSKVEIDPRKILSLYPFLVPKELLTNVETLETEITKFSELEKRESILQLIDYLYRIRNKKKLKNYQNYQEILTTIDTVLVKGYITTNTGLVLPFLRLKNSCDLIETEKLLKKKNLEKELIALYKSRGKHQEALELVEKICKKSNNFYEFVNYLENLNYENLDLIFQYSKPLYDIDPNQCLEIFTFDNQSKENPKGRNLPKKVILQFLKEEIPSLVIPYLEYHIFELKNKEPEFHNDLLLLYQKENKSLLKKLEIETESNKLQQFAKMQGVAYLRIHNFIVESQYYNPGKMLTNFPMDDSLLEERAILLSRVGQHEQALEIYSQKKEDFEKAEEYCILNYKKDGETKDIFLLLLKKYLEKSDSEVMLEQALKILKKHITKINPQKAIKILPKNISLSQMFDYLRAVVKNLTEIKRNLLVTKNLQKSEILNLKVKSVQFRNRSFTIDQNTLCQVCGKRIGQSIFGRFPNGILAHMACIKDNHICPKTKKDFSVYQNDFY